ncbi:DDT domain-containing protein PTM-like [Zingiber officinale]|uniref:DDT domain-containing protein PTM-like n=1 Tax=Zingiber officinale TaxID=94328 RepID=UPI001C4B6FF4|nr:DDT domain-containing protein PTM-like [Zingiber officinale]XP_042457402.1 DDT domain-containing protein PTM-like [Zingiber officinale]
MGSVVMDIDPEENMEAQNTTKEPIDPLSDVRKTEEEVSGENAAALVGSYASKVISGVKKALVGKVASYDHESRLYSVVYEDGTREDLDSFLLSKIIVSEDGSTSSNLKNSCKKRKLDLLVSSGSTEPNMSSPGKRLMNNVPNASGGSGTSSERLDSELSEDANSSNNSPDYMQASCSVALAECHILDLPPSSGDIAIPEESISYLFSVYGFLRSLSVQLYLSPFGMDDFVGSLNCMVQNSLLDAIHLQLLRALRRHIQVVSSEGSELASRCLRHYDWSLLDALTWPAFVTEYLYLMGYMRSLEGKGYGTILSDGEYYRLPVTAKLKILQILCDDVIDSAEIRTELEMREDLEDDEEDNLDLSHPLDSGPCNVRSRSSRISAKVPVAQVTTLKITESEADTSTGNIDGNSDECQLCGMDGTLICCDGCPSAYHSRCIGLNKAFLPSGQWFCPECVADKNCPASIKVGRGIKGAEYFGTDACGRIFLASCNYLLVIGAVLDADPFCRYYNKADISKVLSLLSSVRGNASSYAHICDGILKFWEIPANSLETGQAKPMEGNNVCTDRESSSDMEARSHTSVLNSITQARFPEMQPNTTKQNVAIRKTELTSLETLSYLNGTHRLTTPDISSCISTNESLTSRGDSGTSHVFNKGYAVGLSDGSRYGIQIRNEKTRNGRTSFNPQVYGNQYIHGDVAASAAANLVVLSTEEKRFSETHVSSNSRKTPAAIISLQMKAFTEATMYFLWPSFEKKLLDVPRERCGWCIACKGSITNRKGCFLNLAAANALKGSARNNTGFRPTKHCETHFPTIAAYVANIEETLHGLIDGALLDANYNLQWRRKIREASSCRVLKILLLELEQSIRSIAFSGTWFKLLNDGLLKFPATTICSSLNGPSQKRGPGRRSKKQLASESALASSESSRKDVQWWRGGKLSKIVLQTETLPSSLVKKAARQGGFKRIPDICYSESLELPRRSRQFAWRAAVQMCKNTSQLALQVRYLDAHIRWKDLVPPDQANLDVRGLDGDASAFRNVVICDKRSIGNKIIYALIFSSQKHIPLRVMKNVLEKESIDSENSKSWFSENHVPLYLIKDYEERIHEKLLPGSVTLGIHARPKFQEKQLKFRPRDVFYYLLHKGDKPSNSSCASCKGDVNLRDASTCSICQGKCHKDCAIPLIDRTGSSLAFNITCRICYHDKTAALNASRMEIRNTHLSKGIQDQSLSHKKIMLPMTALNTIGSTAKVVVQGKNILVPSSKKEGKSKRATTSTYGLIWKRKNGNDDNGGQDFRLVNIVLRKTEGLDSSRKPTCCLCNAPYRSDLMYIRCEKCLNWYHADALELEEAQIFDLVGFKCCRCRRKASPKCPYDCKKPELNFVQNRNRLKSTMPDNSTLAHRSVAASSVAKEGLSVINGDLLPRSSGIIEQIQTMEAAVHLSVPKPEHNSQQKLSVRRPHPTATTDLCSVSQSPARNSIPCEIDDYTFSVTNDKIFANSSEMLTSYDYQDSASCGAVSFNDIKCDDQWNDDQTYEDAEDYEPQTYFSFTELLASENDRADVSDDPTNAGGIGCLSGCGKIGSYEELKYAELGPQGVYLAEEDMENKGSAVHNLLCNICKLDDPPADLLCEVCGQLIHSHCSPWVEDEEPSGGANWRCGRCRDWC